MTKANEPTCVVMHKMSRSREKMVFFSSTMAMIGCGGMNALRLTDEVVSPLAIAFQEESELRELFNHHLLKMIESGVVKAITKKWLFLPDEVFELHDPAVLGFNNVAFPFLVLLFWIVCSLVLSLIEHLFRLLKKEPTEK